MSVDALLEVANHAVTHNKVFCLNLSAPFLIQFFQVGRHAALESSGLARFFSFFPPSSSLLPASVSRPVSLPAPLVIAGPDEPGHAVRGLCVRQRVRGRHLRRDQGSHSETGSLHTRVRVRVGCCQAERRQASRCLGWSAVCWCSVGVVLRRRRPILQPCTF